MLFRETGNLLSFLIPEFRGKASTARKIEPVKNVRGWRFSQNIFVVRRQKEKIFENTTRFLTGSKLRVDLFFNKIVNFRQYLFAGNFPSANLPVFSRRRLV